MIWFTIFIKNWTPFKISITYKIRMMMIKFYSLWMKSGQALMVFCNEWWAKLNEILTIICTIFLFFYVLHQNKLQDVICDIYNPTICKQIMMITFWAWKWICFASLSHFSLLIVLVNYDPWMLLYNNLEACFQNQI
jgi:hypothetical protein